MGTRATYQFKTEGGVLGASICFYVHWDGYLEGAAEYFAAAVDYYHSAPEGHRSGLAGAFFRANNLAEFTRSHDAHGDTDFAYTLEQKKEGVRLKAVSNAGRFNEPEQPAQTVFYGKLEDFLNTYKENASGQFVGFRNSVYTKAQIERDFKNAANQSLWYWLDGMSGNATLSGFDDLSSDVISGFDEDLQYRKKLLEMVTHAYRRDNQNLAVYVETARAFGVDAHHLLIGDLLTAYLDPDLVKLFEYTHWNRAGIRTVEGVTKETASASDLLFYNQKLAKVQNLEAAVTAFRSAQKQLEAQPEVQAQITFE